MYRYVYVNQSVETDSLWEYFYHKLKYVVKFFVLTKYCKFLK